MTMTDDQLTEWLTALIEAKPDLVLHDQGTGRWTVRYGATGPAVEWDSRTTKVSVTCGDTIYTGESPTAHRSALAFAEGYAIGSTGKRYANNCTAALSWLLDAHDNRVFWDDRSIHMHDNYLIGYVYFDDNGPAGFRACSQLTGQPVELPGVFPASFDPSEYD